MTMNSTDLVVRERFKSDYGAMFQPNPHEIRHFKKFYKIWAVLAVKHIRRGSCLKAKV